MMNFSMLTGKVKTRAMIACPECGREFQRNRKADLQRHMRIHTNEKPFVCPYPECGKAFRQSSALKNHSNYHQRDNSFTCAQCKMNFFDKPTFNRHVREKHDLEYVYACSVERCGKHFKRKPVFKAHVQDKHGLLYGDQEILNHRVSAEPYIRAAQGSKAVYHSNSSSLPKLSDALQSVRPAQTPIIQINSSTYYPSNPAVYGTNHSDAVLLTDPYTAVANKPEYQTYTPSANHYAQVTEYPANFASSDFWLTTGGPNDTTYFDGQIVSTSQLAACMQTAPPTISFSPASSPQRPSPNSSFVLSGASSGNSPSGSMGSYSPHSTYSPIPSSSPVSPIASPGTHSQQPQYTLRPYGMPPYY